MKVVKVLSNRLKPIKVRVLKLQLACGHVQKLTQMSASMRLPRFSHCRLCRRGW